MNKHSSKYRIYHLLRLILPVVAVLFAVGISGCDKGDDEPAFNPDFSFTYVDDNHVKFENQSTGEYYFITWNFADGTGDTTITDKNKSITVYYPAAGDYDVTMTLSNYTGTSKSITKTVSIAGDDLVVDFTMEIDSENPNYVTLTNTSSGIFDSFIWTFRGTEVENVEQYQAYFPFAGNYDITLTVIKNNIEYTKTQSVEITQDDPNYNPNLVWSEEFDYTGLPDQAKWNMETGGDGWGNSELQYYTNSENNAYVDNGMLTITAREEQFGGRNYTSARITTQGKFDFKYGRIEARIKLPYGQGLWPAFWMLGTNINSVGWPSCGEIDIMELVGGSGGDNTCHTTLHWDNNGENAAYGESYTLASGIFADDFHVFAVEWDDQEIRGYVDGTQFYTADITPAGLSEFHKNFFVILNVAVGGTWPGPPNANTVFPQTMQVDWVRVYQQ